MGDAAASVAAEPTIQFTRPALAALHLPIRDLQISAAVLACPGAPAEASEGTCRCELEAALPPGSGQPQAAHL
jgi:hypothetical protein